VRVRPRILVGWILGGSRRIAPKSRATASAGWLLARAKLPSRQPADPSARKPAGLMPQIQFPYEDAVALNVDPHKIVQKTPALADHFQQAAPRVVIFFVGFQVLVEMVYPLREDRHLNLRGAGVAVVELVQLDDLRFLFLLHCFLLFYCHFIAALLTRAVVAPIFRRQPGKRTENPRTWDAVKDE
jgi:hypothetical protein